MADDFAVRMYRNERARHSAAARQALQDVVEVPARLLERWDATPPVIRSGEARRIFGEAATAYARAEALEATEALSFLVDGPEQEG